MQGEGYGFLVLVPVMRSKLDTLRGFHAFDSAKCPCFIAQIPYTAPANARFSIYKRLVLWLVMYHDRGGNHLGRTHEFLSIMLGVRRSE